MLQWLLSTSCVLLYPYITGYIWKHPVIGYVREYPVKSCHYLSAESTNLRSSGQCKYESEGDMKPTVYTTQQGTRYLKEPGVVLISKPAVDLSGMHDFLEDFGFADYLNDPTELASGAQL